MFVGSCSDMSQYNIDKVFELSCVPNSESVYHLDLRARLQFGCVGSSSNVSAPSVHSVFIPAESRCTVVAEDPGAGPPPLSGASPRSGVALKLASSWTASAGGSTSESKVLWSPCYSSSEPASESTSISQSVVCTQGSIATSLTSDTCICSMVPLIPTTCMHRL